MTINHKYLGKNVKILKGGFKDKTGHVDEVSDSYIGVSFEFISKGERILKFDRNEVEII